MRNFVIVVCLLVLCGQVQAQSTSGTLQKQSNSISFLPTDLTTPVVEKSSVSHRELSVMFADLDKRIPAGIQHFPSHSDSEFLDILTACGVQVSSNDKYTMKCLVRGMCRDDLNKTFEALRTSTAALSEGRMLPFSSIMRAVGCTQVDFRVGMFIEKYQSSRNDGTCIIGDDIPLDWKEEINSAMISLEKDLHKTIDTGNTRAKAINDYILEYNRTNPKSTITALDLSESMKTKIVDAAMKGKSAPPFERK